MEDGTMLLCCDIEDVSKHVPGNEVQMGSVHCGYDRVTELSETTSETTTGDVTEAGDR